MSRKSPAEPPSSHLKQTSRHAKTRTQIRVWQQIKCHKSLLQSCHRHTWSRLADMPRLEHRCVCGNKSNVTKVSCRACILIIEYWIKEIICALFIVVNKPNRKVKTPGGFANHARLFAISKIRHCIYVYAYVIVYMYMQQILCNKIYIYTYFFMFSEWHAPLHFVKRQTFWPKLGVYRTHRQTFWPKLGVYRTHTGCRRVWIELGTIPLVFLHTLVVIQTSLLSHFMVPIWTHWGPPRHQ